MWEITHDYDIEEYLRQYNIITEDNIDPDFKISFIEILEKVEEK